MCAPSDLDRIPQSDYVIACQAPSKEDDNYESTYLRATLNLMAALRRNKPRRLLFVSSSAVYGVHDGSWVDADTEVSAEAEGLSENAKKLVEAEKLVFSSGFKSIVLRLSGIYGPGRNRVKAILDGKFTAGFSDSFTNRIHVDDAAQIIRFLLEKGKPGEAYIGTDDAPTTQKEFFEWIYSELQRPLPENPADQGQPRGSKRLRNDKLKEAGYVFKYPTFEEGYSEIISQLIPTSDIDSSAG